MIKLALLRHGESLWNRENRFSRWTDVDLYGHGMIEAREAGKTVKSKGYYPVHDPRYRELDDHDLPLTECLRDTVKRFLLYQQGGFRRRQISGPYRSPAERR